MNNTRFMYHAYAAGLSARITRPFEETLQVQAPSALPSSGGYSSARQTDIRIREIFSCGAVHTEAAGSHNSKTDSHDTSSTSTVERFNLSDVVVADRITARISSSHPANVDVEPAISPLGTVFEGLRIAGRDIELESLIDDFAELNTMSLLRTGYKKNEIFRTLIQKTAMIGRRKDMADERLHKFFPWSHREPSDILPEFRQTSILPLFRVRNPSAPGFTVHGNVIYVKDFGRIHIGELVVTPYERRVSSLHIDLGSPMDGTFDANAVGANGSTNDPPVGP